MEILQKLFKQHERLENCFLVNKIFLTATLTILLSTSALSIIKSTNNIWIIISIFPFFLLSGFGIVISYNRLKKSNYDIKEKIRELAIYYLEDDDVLKNTNISIPKFSKNYYCLMCSNPNIPRHVLNNKLQPLVNEINEITWYKFQIILLII